MKDKVNMFLKMFALGLILQIITPGIVKADDFEFCKSSMISSWLIHRNNSVKRIIKSWLNNKKEQVDLDKDIVKLTRYEILLSSCAPPLNISEDFYLLDIKNLDENLIPISLLKKYLKKRNTDLDAANLFKEKTFYFKKEDGLNENKIQNIVNK